MKVVKMKYYEGDLEMKYYEGYQNKKYEGDQN